MKYLKILIHVLILRPFIKLMFGINIYGRKHIQNLDGYVMISNHNSHLDILLLFYNLPLKDIPITHPLAAYEYFSRSKILFGLVNFLFSPIWVNRENSQNRNSVLEKMKKTLEKGHNIILFPEGTRGEPGKIQPFKSGIGRLAQECHNIPIVPVFLFGPERALPRRYFLPVPIWMNVMIAPPQIFQESHLETTHALEKIIQELSQTKAALYHNRRQKEGKPKLIAFLGIDGSGKSTISKNVALTLSNENNTAVISDTIKFYEKGVFRQLQPLITDEIRKVIGRIAKNAKSLKLYKIPKLTELLLRDYLLHEVNNWYVPHLITLDGCTILNLTAWSILYKEHAFDKDVCKKAIRILSSKDAKIEKNDPIYKDFSELLFLKKLGLNKLQLPDIVFFLDVPPQIAMERIDQRGEKASS